MKGIDKLLVAILGGIVALIVVGLAVLFLIGTRSETVLSEDTPEGVVQRFVLALEKRDADAAYNYLSGAVKSRWSLDEFRSAVAMGPQMFGPSPSGERSSRAVLNKVTVSGDTANVLVTISTGAAGGPLTYDEYTRDELFTLRHEGGQWKIESFPEYEYLRSKEFRTAPPVVVVTPIPVTPTPTPQLARG